MNMSEMLYRRDFLIQFTKYLQRDIQERAAFLNSIGKEPDTDTIFCMEKIIESEKIQESTLLKRLIDKYQRKQEREGFDKMMRGNNNKYGGENI